MTDDETMAAAAVALQYPAQAFAEEPQVEVAVRAAVADRDPAGLARLLAGAPGLHEWMAKVLDDDERRPPHLQPDLIRDFVPALFGSQPPPARFVCPRDGYEWFRRHAAQELPLCRTCGGALRPS